MINQFKTVEKSKKDFSDQDDEIKPHPFLDIVLWNYWETRLKLYLHLVDGTTVILLSYVIRDSVAPVPDPTAPILKQCVLMEPHHGPVYQ